MEIKCGFYLNKANYLCITLHNRSNRKKTKNISTLLFLFRIFHQRNEKKTVKEKESFFLLKEF